MLSVVAATWNNVARFSHLSDADVDTSRACVVGSFVPRVVLM